MTNPSVVTHHSKGQTASDIASNPFLQKAYELAPLIEAEATKAEKLGTMSPAVVEAFREAGLFWMLVPRELGGPGTDLVGMMEVLEEVTRADGSTGWSLMANCTAAGIAGAFCSDSGARTIFGGDSLPIMAGMFGPGGKAVEVANGYTGGGDFKFGSGCAHANWIGAGCMVMGEKGPKKLENGNPEVRISFFPRNKIEIKEEWNVLGLVATGSYDYVVPEQHIDQELTIERSTTDFKRGDSFFRLGIPGVGSAGHTAIALGLMSRALQEVVSIVTEKKRPLYPSVVADDPVFKHEFAINEASFQSARLLAYQVFADAQSAAAENRVLPHHRQRLYQVMTWSHKVAADVVRFAHMWGGSQAIGGDSELGRCLRNTFVATQHVFVDPISLVNSAPAVIETWRR